MLNQRCSFVAAAVVGDDGVVHDFKCDAVDEVVWDFALLLVCGVREGKGGAQVVALLFVF